MTWKSLFKKVKTASGKFQKFQAERRERTKMNLEEEYKRLKLETKVAKQKNALNKAKGTSKGSSSFLGMETPSFASYDEIKKRSSKERYL